MLRNDGEIDLHAKSYAVEAIFDWIREENIGNNIPNEVIRAGNENEIIVEGRGNEYREESDEIGGK
jgi:hypothetical protein